jgi:hypothetical protein
MDNLKTPITTLKQIDTSTKEGRLLMAAICKIHGRDIDNKNPGEILEQLNKLAEKIFSDDNTEGHITKRSSGTIVEAAHDRTNEASKSGNKDLAN